MALRLTGAAAVPSRLAVAREPGHGGSLVGDVGRLGGRLGRYLLGPDSRWTGDRQPGVSAQPLSGPESLFDELRAFDPRTRGGLVNLATMFVPGPKGGRLPAWQLKLPGADLEATLGKAGVQPSSWITRPDSPFKAGLRARLGQPRQRGIARDPDSAAVFYERAGGRAGVPAHVARAVGPRLVGGVYRSGYWGETYRVLDIKALPSGEWGIKVEPIDPHAPYSTGPRWHSTAWDPLRDRVVEQPFGMSPSASAYLDQLRHTRYDPKIHKPGG